LKPLSDVALLEISLFEIFKSYQTQETASSWDQKKRLIKNECCIYWGNPNVTLLSKIHVDTPIRKIELL
jgi:hypothetical protein